MKGLRDMMGVRLRSILAGLCACLLLGAALVLPACDRAAQGQTPVPQLAILSPHNGDIKREFAQAFSAWHLDHFGQPVEVVWPDIGGGGTGNLVKYLDAAFAHKSSSGDDLMFGGGSAAFNTFAQNGYLVPLPPVTSDELRLARWPHDPLDDVPLRVFDNPLRGGTDRQENLWIAATMSAFGIEINPDRIAELHRKDPRLDTPRTWEDLAGPQWFGHLSLADPSKSGSVKTSYEMLLQQNGWERGWPILVQLFANAAMIRESGSYPADDVASAEAVAGICIDFYGRLQISRVGPRIASFVIPEGGTGLDADPIALLKGAPHAELAARFVRFVVSPDGQRLWVNRPGLTNAQPGSVAGPRHSALGRLSVLPDLYQTEAGNLVDSHSPFAARSLLKVDAGKSALRNAYLGDLIRAALIDNHAALRQARQAIRDAGDPADLLQQLIALPEFPTCRLENGGLKFSDDAAKPAFQLLDEASLKTLADAYAPPRESPLAPYAEQIHTHCKDVWRQTFAQRFARLESAARSRH